ncbi:MAG: ATP-binding protein, partial [Chloroflexi bacterium]|nr:ATP-binding protein [Chloroflexota bacterium]
MGRVVDVEINAAKALITLGSMYRNAADAIKEYVSNALDEWAKVRQEGGAGGQCKVYFTLSKNSITIDYNAPGMDEAGFEDALKHVVDSRKEGLDIPQIGRLGIGLWAFNQVGDRATFYSKRSLDTPTIKVVLTRNSSEAEFFDPDPGEEREIPGMTIEITGLFQDPTRRYGPVSQARLKHVMADRFDVYLRTGQLKITIRCGKVESEV